jgi:hypothetical protein
MASESIKRKFKNRHKCWKKLPKIRKLIYDDDVWAITGKHNGKHSDKSEWQDEHHNKGFSYYTKIQRQNKDEEAQKEAEEAMSDVEEKTEDSPDLQGNSI